ncbi:hypothetical protein [Microbacterium sp. bgisy189]|uniref:hypothetical protein n=1 Tax=Microbacterium sp. bgisy189 TaxID=3413798 RepID=UPI003EBBC4B1
MSGMSPAARRLRKRGFLVWGIVVLVVWAICSWTFASLFGQGGVSFEQAFISGQALVGWIFLLLGVVLLAIGVFGEIRARRFNARDKALAEALHRRLVEFVQLPRAVMYTDEQAAGISGARLIEIERHFDQQTQGAITGTLELRLRMFATSFGTTTGRTYGDTRYGYDRAWSNSTTRSTTASTTSGTIQGGGDLNLSLSQTTRDNLMGDALFAVFEVAGEDTFRVVSMSTPAAREWMADLIRGVAADYGGDQTHSGGVIGAWVPNLVQQFGPEDVSYATDRLKAIAARPFDERVPVDVQGAPVARNAMIAVTMGIGGARLELLPIAFPNRFGEAIGAADTAVLAAPAAMPQVSA